jgi:serine/threonine protein kinase
MAQIGNYKIIKQIGEGGFGRIFQAEHILLKEKACLKQNKDASKEDADLLCLEARLLWKLDEYHSIPATKDFFKIADNNYVLVLNYIDGKTVDDFVKSNSRIHPEDACWITERLLGALFYCHYNGVIHSDVKPENVFVEPKKHDIKLIDFGLAAYRPKHTTTPIGYTPKYAAPELKQGRPPIPETDIYGAGVVLACALGADIDDKSFHSDTPKEIKDFCNELLRFDPTQRPNWEKNNPLKKLSDIRFQVFGRKHVSG